MEVGGALQLRRSAVSVKGVVVSVLSGNTVTVREVIKLIEADGWYLDRQRSSHRQFKHPTKPGLVTVAGHPPKVLAPKTLRSILRQAGLAL